MTRIEINEQPKIGFDGAFYDWQRIRTVEEFLDIPNHYDFWAILTPNYAWLYKGDYSYRFMPLDLYDKIMDAIRKEIASMRMSDPEMLLMDKPWDIRSDITHFEYVLREDPCQGHRFDLAKRNYSAYGDWDIECAKKECKFRKGATSFRTVYTANYIWLYYQAPNGEYYPFTIAERGNRA